MTEDSNKPRIKVIVRTYATRPHYATRIYDETLKLHRVYVCGVDITDEVDATGIDVWNTTDEDEIMDAVQLGVDSLVNQVWETNSVELALRPEQFAIRLFVKPGMENKVKTAKVRKVLCTLLECAPDVADDLIECSLLPEDLNHSQCGEFPKEVAGMQATFLQQKLDEWFTLRLASPISEINEYIREFVSYVAKQDDSEPVVE